MSTTTSATQADIAGLKNAVDCPVILPGERHYDLQRHVWNADIDRNPLAIVSCRTAQDVSRALTWCLENGFEVTVRGGGHNLAGTAVIDGAVLLDTGPMKDVSFDHAAGTVTAGAGCRLGDLDRACAEHGVVVPAGTVSHTGVAGLTLGGGTGYLSRMFGLTTDHVVEVEFVVADGRILTVNENEHPELFWAVRGAGHNYGIATKFTFKYTPFTLKANVRQAFYVGEDRKRVLQHFRDWSYDAADNVVTYARTVEVPEYWSVVPAKYRGSQVVSVATIHWGDAEEGRRLTDGMMGAGSPVWSTEYQVPHVELQGACDDDFRYGVRRYWKNSMLNEFPDEAIDTVLKWSDAYPGRPLQARSTIAPHFACPYQLYPRGGQAARVDPMATSTSDRTSAKFMASAGAEWEFPSEAPELMDWVSAFDAEMDPYKNGTYINFTSVAGDESAARYAYGDKYDRLVAVKREYDPHNVFRRGLVDLSDHADEDEGDAGA